MLWHDLKSGSLQTSQEYCWTERVLSTGMVQNSSWLLFGWGYFCQRRVNQLLNPRVYILFPPSTVNVYTVFNKDMKMSNCLCVISLSRLCLPIIVTKMQIRSNVMTNLCRNPVISKGFTYSTLCRNPGNSKGFTYFFLPLYVHWVYKK